MVSDKVMKMYWRTGQAAATVGLTVSTILDYETQFPHLHPKRKSNGYRRYTRQDMLLLLYLKRLIKQEGYTIYGARLRLYREIACFGSLNKMLERNVRHEL